MFATTFWQPLVALLCLISATAGLTGGKASDAVRLSQVKTLTLRHGELTSGRRLDPIPQMSCVGGSGEPFYSVDLMQCQNVGSEYDAEAIQWKCTASLPPEFKLGSTDVFCEGYDSADDPYVLKGSCGVEYRLILTDAGQAQYGNQKPQNGKQHDPTKEPFTKPTEGPNVAAILFWIVFISILCFIIYKALNPNHPRAAAAGGNLGWHGGGGGGGGGGDGYDHPSDDPPPPYTPRAPPSTRNPRSSTPLNPAGKSYGTRGSSSRSSRSSNSAWRPGFWTGTAAGAAAGYAAGNYASNRSANQAAQSEQAPQASPSNWFGRNTNTRTNGNTFGGPSGFQGAGSGSSPSSDRYQSTGFGGTRRR